MKARDFRAMARAALQGNWALSIGVALVAMLLGGGGNLGSSGGGAAGSQGYDGGNVYDSVGGAWDSLVNSLPSGMLAFMGVMTTLSVVYMLVCLIFGGATTLGLRQYYIDLVTKQRPLQFSTLFSRYSFFGKAFLLNLLIGIFSFLWLLLCMVGFFLVILLLTTIVAASGGSSGSIAFLVVIILVLTFALIAGWSLLIMRYSMAFYVMTQNPENISAMQAIRASKTMMKGNVWRLFCMEFSFIGWILLVPLTCGIGVLWLNPYIGAAEASFYLELTGQLPGQGMGWQPAGYPDAQGAYPTAPPPGYMPYDGAQQGAPQPPPAYGYGAPPTGPAAYPTQQPAPPPPPPDGTPPQDSGYPPQQ